MSYDNDELMWEEGNSYFNDDNELDILVEKEEKKKKNKPKYKMSDFDWGDGAENQTSQSPQISEDVIKVKAYLDNIVFPKYPKVLGEDDDTWGVTNWCILETLEGSPELNNRGLLVVTGDFFGPLDYGKPYTIVGKANETKYGMQYKLIYYNQEFDLTKVNNQKAFLATILTEQQIKDIFDTLDNPLQSIADHDIEALMKVHNIGPVYAQKIIERYEDNKDMSAVYMELDGYGVTPNIIGKLRNYYKSPSKIIEMVKYHPYQLTFDIDGIGFLTADKIALAGGLHPKDPDRIGAWIKWFMEEEGNKGHSYITASELTSNLFYYFEGRENIEETYYDDNGNVIGNNILEAMENLKDNNIICLEEREDRNKSRRRVYLKRYWELEKNIANELERLLKAKNRFNYIGWEDKIKELEEKQGFNFAPEQLDGIKLGLDNNVCFISGLGGTGKTSLVTGILAALDKYSFAQCALSGKASARLAEVTGEEGFTIHRLLRYTGLGFEYKEDNKLPYNIIILDELSLVGGEIFLSLIKAIDDGAKLIMLGDMGQLESIGALNLAADLHNSPKIPVVELTQVHRQAAQSGIITTAHKVRYQDQIFDKGYEGILTLGELKDMELDVQEEKDEILERCLNYFEKFFTHPLVKENIMNIQLVSPVKERGNASVFNLNLGVQNIYNPVDENDAIPKIKIKLDKEKFFYIQKEDKIMNMKNNYQTKNIDGVNTPIFNGWTGIVKDIDENFVYIDFPLAGGIVMLEKKEARNQLSLGYASTVHKLQGSDFPVVIGAIDYSTPPNMLTSQLVYTLITRAKKFCALVCQGDALRKAIATDFVSSKRTFLPEFLEEI